MPSPDEVKNTGYLEKTDENGEKEEVEIQFKEDPKLPFVGYAFKLEENKFG